MGNVGGEMRAQLAALALVTGALPAALASNPAAAAPGDGPERQAAQPADVPDDRDTQESEPGPSELRQLTAAAATSRASATRRVATGPDRLVTTPGQQTTEGLTQDVAIDYDVMPGEVRTRVTVTAHLTNTQPDRVVGNAIEYYYFEAYTIPVPREATNVSASRDGAALTVSIDNEPGMDLVSLATVTLSPALRNGSPQTIVISYDLTAQDYRSTDTLSQANEAFFMFPVVPLGDPGLSSVTVTIPSSYEVEAVGSQLERRNESGNVVLSASGIDDPGFASMILASDESRLVTETIDVEGTEVNLQAWPGDAEWVSFVSDQVQDGSVVLAELIGQPWPAEELTIIETMAPIARGYGGWYDPDDHSIRIGNELDPQLMLHELTHVWINLNLFEDRWIVEGLADTYTYQALDELGLEPTEALPSQVPPTFTTPLNSWVTPSQFQANQEDLLNESLGYEASWYVMDQIVTEIGIEALQEIISIAEEGTITYPAGDEAETHSVPMDWRRTLDLVQNVGGSELAETLFRDHIVTATQEAELADRATARQSYADLAAQGDEWEPPLEVRQDMAEWEFDDAEESIAEAGAILALRGRIDTALEGTDVRELALEQQYTTAESLTELRPLAEDTLAAAEAYADVHDEANGGHGPLGAIGLWGTDTGAKLDDAEEALEEGDVTASLAASGSLDGQLDAATRNGLLRLAGALLVIGVGVGTVLVVRRNRAVPQHAPIHRF